MRTKWFGVLTVVVIVLLLGIALTSNWFTEPKRPGRQALRHPQPQAPAAADGHQEPNAAFSLESAPELMRAMLPRQHHRGGFVSSDACRECHRQQYHSWHDSFHRTMTQVASPATVLAPFERVELSSRGRDYALSREDDQYFVTMADPDWEAGAVGNGLDLDRIKPPIVTRPVVMTTGSHHMQGYWIASSIPNMLRQIPWVYLIEERRWVPREDIFLAPSEAGRHLAVWNDNCLVCHAVAGAPKFDLQRMTVATEVAELGIACEACHGPGAAHIQYRKQRPKNDVALAAPADPADPIVNPANCQPRVSAEICGQCHSYFEPPDMEAFAVQGYTYRAGSNLRASHNLISYQTAKSQHNESAMATYWNDGTCRVAGREYSAMMESACFKNGQLTCISCHSSHSSQPDDQLASGMRTNQACLQCHTTFAEKIEAHTHHASDSSGSLCYNCHMPHTSFGVLKAMRSHRIQVPKALSDQQSDQPNACNLCHLDKSLAWTAEKLGQWYGQPPPQLDSDEQRVAGSLLWTLRGNAVQRAVTAWHMSWPPAVSTSGDRWQAPFLAELLNDDYAVVRYVAGKSLRQFPSFATLRFDFVGSPESRRSSREQAVAMWKAQNVSHDAGPQASEALLLDAHTGQPLADRIKELLDQQDKRPIYLPE